MVAHEPDRKRAAEQEAPPLKLNEVLAGLATQRIGTKLHYFAELDSTNIFARRLAEQGAPAGGYSSASYFAAYRCRKDGSTRDVLAAIDSRPRPVLWSSRRVWF